MPEPLRSEGDTRDERLMRIALALAERGRGAVEPNPLVGCVIVRDGNMVGQGFHRQFGGAHAEIEALQSLPSPEDARGATAYVSLEPCCHHGKTPPCSEALISAGIARVVVAMEDPFPRVDGGGIRQLRDAGVETEVGLLTQQAEFQNAPYLKKVRQGKPWVIAKWAMTIDGRIATVDGDSQWITGAAAREEVHRLRARVDGVAVGMGTVQADDPILTARLAAGVEIPRMAKRVVFCRARLPSLNSKLVQSAREVPLHLFFGKYVDESKAAALQSHGAQITRLEHDEPHQMIDAALNELASQGATNLLVEGGGELLASFFAVGQIDECHVYLGAKAFGGSDASGPIGGRGVSKVSESTSFSLLRTDQFDNDLRAIYRRVPAEASV